MNFFIDSLPLAANVFANHNRLLVCLGWLWSNCSADKGGDALLSGPFHWAETSGLLFSTPACYLESLLLTSLSFASLLLLSLYWAPALFSVRKHSRVGADRAQTLGEQRACLEADPSLGGPQVILPVPLWGLPRPAPPLLQTFAWGEPLTWASCVLR